MTIKTEMNHEHADKALHLFRDIATYMDLDWKIFAGTCLGFRRDKTYLPGDNDIDIAVMPKPGQLNELWMSLHQAGFKLGKTNENQDGSRNRHTYYHPDISHPDEGGLLVDVFFAFNEYEANLLAWSDAIYYKDELWPTPHPVDAYLQSAYGEWWDKSLRNSAEGKEYARTL